MNDWKPTRQAIEALVELIPALETKPGTDWNSEQVGEGAFTMPTLPPDDAEAAFVQRAYEHEWVYPFDWSDWQPRAQEYLESPELLARAPLATLRKLITTHLRKERFCEGHLRHMRQCGHLQAILERLRDYLEGDADPEPTDPKRLAMPDRSDQIFERTRRFSDEPLSFGEWDRRLRDGRPCRIESWSESGFLMQTVFLPIAGLEDATRRELIDLLLAEGLLDYVKSDDVVCAKKVADARGAEVWSINVVLGDEDGLYLPESSDD